MCVCVCVHACMRDVFVSAFFILSVSGSQSFRLSALSLARCRLVHHACAYDLACGVLAFAYQI